MSKFLSNSGNYTLPIENNKKILILNNSKVIFALMLPFFSPTSFDYIAPKLAQVFNILRVVSFAVIFFVYITNSKISKFIFMIFLYEFTIFLSTMIHNGELWKFLRSAGSIIGFCMLTEICIKNNSKLYFKCVFFLCFILVFINFIFLNIYPNGLVPGYNMDTKINFIGSDNELPPLFIPFMAAACIYSSYKRKKLTFMSLLLIVCISATIIITWAATGVVGWFIMLVYILFIYKGKLTSFFNSKLLLITFIVAQISIVFLRIQNIFSYFINDILGKEITFSARTMLWDSAFILIKAKPILGYGTYAGTGLIFRNGWYYTAHNAILEVMLQGGLIALIAFSALFIVAAIPLYKYRNHFISGIIAMAIFSMLIMMLMEVHSGHFMLYWLLTIATCVPDIIRQLDKV